MTRQRFRFSIAEIFNFEIFNSIVIQNCTAGSSNYMLLYSSIYSLNVRMHDKINFVLYLRGILFLPENTPEYLVELWCGISATVPRCTPPGKTSQIST